MAGVLNFTSVINNLGSHDIDEVSFAEYRWTREGEETVQSVFRELDKQHRIPGVRKPSHWLQLRPGPIIALTPNSSEAREYAKRRLSRLAIVNLNKILREDLKLPIVVPEESEEAAAASGSEHGQPDGDEVDGVPVREVAKSILEQVVDKYIIDDLVNDVWLSKLQRQYQKYYNAAKLIGRGEGSYPVVWSDRVNFKKSQEGHGKGPGYYYFTPFVEPNLEMWYMFGLVQRAIVAHSIREGVISAKNPGRAWAQVLCHNEQARNFEFNEGLLLYLRLWYRGDLMLSRMFVHVQRISYTAVWNAIVAPIFIAILSAQGLFVTQELPNNSLEVLWLMITTKFTFDLLIVVRVAFTVFPPMRSLLTFPIRIVRISSGSNQGRLDYFGVNTILLVIVLLVLGLRLMAQGISAAYRSTCCGRGDGDSSYDEVDQQPSASAAPAMGPGMRQRSVSVDLGRSNSTSFLISGSHDDVDGIQPALSAVPDESAHGADDGDDSDSDGEYQSRSRHSASRSQRHSVLGPSSPSPQPVLVEQGQRAPDPLMRVVSGSQPLSVEQDADDEVAAASAFHMQAMPIAANETVNDMVFPDAM